METCAQVLPGGKSYVWSPEYCDGCLDRVMGRKTSLNNWKCCLISKRLHVHKSRCFALQMTWLFREDKLKTHARRRTHIHPNFIFLSFGMQCGAKLNYINKTLSSYMANMVGKYVNNENAWKKENKHSKMKKEKGKKKSYNFMRFEAKWQPVQSLTRLVLLLVRIRTGIPSNWGSTGWRKGRDSGSWRYKDSKVGIRAWRSSSGLKTEKEERAKQRNEGKLREQRGRHRVSNCYGTTECGWQRKIHRPKHSATPI